MATILGLYERLQQLDTDKIIRESLEASKETYADMNAEQMFKGIRSDGNPILPEYSPLTVQLKKEKGQPTDRVTLHDTGSFYQGIRVDVGSDKLTIDSVDEKSARLQKKYSTRKGSIFGLSAPFRREFLNQKMRPEFKKRIEAATGLKLK